MAAAQAVTALLPIGASGHRLLIAALTGWPPLDVTASIAVYVGMLLAVAGYFWRDIVALIVGIGQIARGRKDAEARLLVLFIAASIPTGAIGSLVAYLKLTPTLTIAAIAWIAVVFGLILYLADRIGVTLRRLSHMTPTTALLIGCVQILALMPGVSRCGIVITVARLLGYERAEAARFSLLLALPVLGAAIAIALLDLAKSGGGVLTVDVVLAGGVSFVVGLIAIALMMSWLRARSFTPIALYRVIGGLAVLGWIYFG